LLVLFGPCRRSASVSFGALRCCHGDDGTGGGHGPNIIDIRQPRATSAEAVRELIRKGIPEKGMPAFTLPDAELGAITAYFMALKTPASGPRAMAGDLAAANAAAGEQFFASKGNCASCHMVRSRGVLGPDLECGTRPHSGGGRRRVWPRHARRGRGGRGRRPYRQPPCTAQRSDNSGLLKNESASRPTGVSRPAATVVEGSGGGSGSREIPMPKTEASPNEMRDLVAYPIP
jgi:mono/diheme cytochrome c family protein